MKYVINSNLESAALTAMNKHHDGETFQWMETFKLKVVHHGRLTRSLRIDTVTERVETVILDAQKDGIWYVSDVSSSWGHLSGGLQQLITKALVAWNAA